MELNFLKILVFLHFFVTTTKTDECPNKCTCKRNLQRDGTEWIKLICGEKEKIDYLDELDLLNIANEIVQL